MNNGQDEQRGLKAALFVLKYIINNVKQSPVNGKYKYILQLKGTAMSVKIFLGNPPAHIETWIKNHSETNLKHSFGVISDIHQTLDYYDEVNDSINPFVTALNVFKSKNITDINMCGDVTDNGSGGEFDAFLGVRARNYETVNI